MKIRVLLAAAATLALAACADSPTATQSPLTPGARSSDDITCRSGYHVATRSDGSEYCEADETQMRATAAP
jgi:hypothetical protein